MRAGRKLKRSDNQGPESDPLEADEIVDNPRLRSSNSGQRNRGNSPRAYRPDRAFSWVGGSLGCPGVLERGQVIVKTRDENARGDQRVRCLWAKGVGRFDIRWI